MAKRASGVLNVFRRLSIVAAVQFLASLLAAILVAGILAGASYYLLRTHPSYGLVVVGLTIVECLVCGLVVGFKRATVLATAEGLRSAGLGRFGVRLIFQQLLGVSERPTSGETSRAAEVTGKIPLAQAERLLKDAVRSVLRAESGEWRRFGWFRQLIQARLFASIGKYTLRQFRAEEAQDGGVDLLKIRNELENSIDEVLPSRLQTEVRWWTVLVSGVFVLAIVAQALVFRLVADLASRAM